MGYAPVVMGQSGEESHRRVRELLRRADVVIHQLKGVLDTISIDEESSCVEGGSSGEMFTFDQLSHEGSGVLSELRSAERTVSRQLNQAKSNVHSMEEKGRAIKGKTVRHDLQEQMAHIRDQIYKSEKLHTGLEDAIFHLEKLLRLSGQRFKEAVDQKRVEPPTRIRATRLHSTTSAMDNAGNVEGTVS